jgi:hypothetical protein
MKGSAAAFVNAKESAVETAVIALVVAGAAIYFVRKVILGRSCSCGREDCAHKRAK